jgi:hypothetical protein
MQWHYILEENLITVRDPDNNIHGKFIKVNKLINLEEIVYVNNNSSGLSTRVKLKMYLHAVSFRS